MSRGAGHVPGWRLAAAVLVVTSAAAQTLPQTSESPNDYPAALPARKGPSPPALLFKLLAEVPLPANPSGGDLGSDGAHLLVPVEGGTASVALSDPMTVGPEDAAPPEARNGSAWTVSADGRFRVRTLPAGWVEAEKLGRFSRKFRPAWRLRAAGATLAPAIPTGRRVIFGSVDNQVYCVRKKNGHRLWAADLEDRITNPLAVWHGPVALASTAGSPATAVQVEAALVVPDGGAALVALDLYDGSRLASFEIASGKGMLATGPFVVADGRIAVARSGYASGGAALLLLQLAASEETPKTGPK